MEDEKRGKFSRMSPKASFFAGLGGAIVLFFIIGFFVLLWVVISGKLETSKDSDSIAVDTTNDSEQKYTEIILDEVTDNDWIRGNKNAPITLVEYSDIECPFCKKFNDTVKQLLEKYPNDLRLVHRHLPLTSLHPNSFKDAEAAECVGELGGAEKFWEYLDILYATDLTSVEQLSELAESVGISKDEFDSCLSSGKYTEKIAKSVDSGSLAAESSSYIDSDPENDGLWGTPFSVIVSGDQKISIPGAYPLEYITPTIDSLLGK